MNTETDATVAPELTATPKKASRRAKPAAPASKPTAHPKAADAPRARQAASKPARSIRKAQSAAPAVGTKRATIVALVARARVAGRLLESRSDGQHAARRSG